MAKRTAEDASLSTDVTPQAEEAPSRQGKKRKTSGGAPKATEPTKTATAAPRKPRKAKSPALPVDAARKPQPKRVRKAIANKIREIKTFHDENRSGSTTLSRSEDNKNHTILVESALTGALVAMAHDWDVEYTYLTALLEAEGAVIERFTKRHDYENDSWKMPMVILDLGKTTTLEQAIHAKIEGHGIEDVNLLQVQLEMYSKQLIEFGKKQLLHAIEEAEYWSEEEGEQLEQSAPSNPEGVDERTKQEESRIVQPHTASPADLEAPEKGSDTKDEGQELEQSGVCPAPHKDL